jgi:hypothetical protein
MVALPMLLLGAGLVAFNSGSASASNPTISIHHVKVNPGTTVQIHFQLRVNNPQYWAMYQCRDNVTFTDSGGTGIAGDDLLAATWSVNKLEGIPMEWTMPGFNSNTTIKTFVCRATSRTSTTSRPPSITHRRLGTTR